MSTLQEEFDICKNKIIDLTVTNDVYFEDNRELIEDCSHYKEFIRDVVVSRAETETKLDEKKRELKQTKRELKQSKSELKQSKRELNQVNKELKELQKELNQANHDLIDTIDELNTQASER